jgi:hypothetical protein
VKQLDTIEPDERNLGKKIFHNQCISNAGQDFYTRRKRNSYINAESDIVPTDTSALSRRTKFLRGSWQPKLICMFSIQTYLR